MTSSPFSYSCFAQNTCQLVRIEPETWTAPESVQWMTEMEAWIQSHCVRFPLHELLPDKDQGKLEGSPTSPFDASFRFHFHPSTTTAADQADAEFIHPHKRIRVILGMLHGPSCLDIKRAVDNFFEQFPPSSSLVEVRILAFQFSPLQLEASSQYEIPQRGVEIFPVNSPVIEMDSPVCFFAQFVFKDIAKRTCLSHLQVVTRAEGILSAARKLGGKTAPSATSAAAVGSSSNISFQSSSLEHFPSTSYQDLVREISEHTFAGDDALLGLAFGNFSSPASRKLHGKLCARLEVWIGKHLLLAGLAKPATVWLETAAAECKQEQELIWESLALETLQASRHMCGDFAVNSNSLLPLLSLLKTEQQRVSIVAATRLLASQSLGIAFAKQDLGLDQVHSTLRDARHAVVQLMEASVAHEYFSQEASLWHALGKERLALFASVEALRYGRTSTEDFDTLLAQPVRTRRERRLVLERAVACAFPGQQPKQQQALRFGFPLLQAWQGEPAKQVELAKLMSRSMNDGNGGILLDIPCPFITSLRCMSRANVEWQECAAQMSTAAAAGEGGGATSSSVFVFDPFSKKVQTATTIPPRTCVWSAGEDNFVELGLCNFLPCAVDFVVERDLGGRTARFELAGKHADDAGGEANKQTILLGPFQHAFPEQAPVCTITVLGAKFQLELPRPDHVLALPLLERDARGITNVGQAVAHFVVGGSGGGLSLAPGEFMPEPSAGRALMYYSQIGFPRASRKLAPIVPELSLVKITACDLREHLEHHTARVALVHGIVLPQTANKLVIRHAGETLLQVEAGEEGKALSQDLRVPLPHNCEFNALDFCLKDDNGALPPVLLSPIQKLSTAPPRWLTDVGPSGNNTLRVATTRTKPLHLVKLQVDWRRQQQQDQDENMRVWFDLQVYDARQNQEKAPCNAVAAAWSGVTHWEALAGGSEETHMAWVSFLECGEYVVVWSATSLLRARWFIQSERISVVEVE